MKCKIIDTRNTRLQEYIDKFGQAEGLRMFVENVKIMTGGEMFREYLGKESSDTTEILTKISTSEHSLAKLAKHLLDLNLPSISVGTVKKADAESSTASAYYNQVFEKISIVEEASFPRSIEAVLLHEIIHYATVSYLNESSELTNELRKLFMYAKLHSTNQELYGYKDVFEFVSEMFTDSILIKDLASIAPKSNTKEYKNLFGELWGFILELLKISKTNKTLYNQAMALGSQIITIGAEYTNSRSPFEMYDLQENFELQDKYIVKPLKGNEVDYKKYNLLTISGELQNVNPESKKTKERLQSLNRSPYNQFTIKKGPDGNFHIYMLLEDTFNQVTADKRIPSEVLDQKIINFLTKLGIHINSLEEIKVKDSNGNEVSIVAKSQLLEGIIDIVNGKRGIDTLSEEAAHFLVELLGDSHPLVQQMLKEIDRFAVYQEVKDEYSSLEAYSGDDAKIRKEAVGKLIAKVIVAKETGSEMPEKIVRAELWFEALWRWLTSKLGGNKANEVKDALEAYSKAADIILQNKTEELMSLEQLRQKLDGKEVVMFQVSPEVDAYRQGILDKLSEELVTKTVGKNGYIVISENRPPMQRVTDIIKKINYLIFGTFDKSNNSSKFAAHGGTMIHSMMEHIINRKIRGEKVIYEEICDAVIKDVKLSDEFEKYTEDQLKHSLHLTMFREISETADRIIKTIDDVEDKIQLQTLMTDEERAARPPIFLTEKIIYSANHLFEDKDVAGSIDLVVIHSNGAASIFDWKSMTLQNYNGEIIAGTQQSKIESFDAQITTYQTILKNAYGIDKFGLLRVVPIHVKYNRDGSISKVETFSAKSSEYLDFLPMSAERTGNEDIDKALDKWTAQRDVLRKSFLNSGRKNLELKHKIERLDKLISSVQLKMDFTIVAESLENLYNVFASREHLIEGNNKITERDIVAMLEELDLYKSFMADGMEFLKNRHAEGDIKLLKKMESAAVNVFKLERGINNKALSLMQERNLDTTTAGEGVSFIGKFTNKLSQYSRGVFQSLSKLVQENFNYTRLHVNELRDELKAANSALDEFAESKGISKFDAFKMLYNEKTGQIHTRTSSKFYEDRDEAIRTKDIKWLLKNTELEMSVDDAGSETLYYVGKALKAYNKSRATHEAGFKERNRNLESKALTVATKKEMKIWDAAHDITVNPDAIYSFTNSFLYYNTSGHYDNSKWTEIQNNPKLKEYYDTYLSINNRIIEETGVNITENFVANIHSSLLEKATATGKLTMGNFNDTMLSLMQVQQDDIFKGYMSVENDMNGKPIPMIPLLYSNPLRVQLTSKETSEETAKVDKIFEKNGWDETSVQYEIYLSNMIKKAEIKKGNKEKSIDLSRSLLLFAEAAYMHKAMSDTESTVKILKHRLQSEDQETVKRSISGKAKINKITGELIRITGTPVEELEVFDKFVNMYWYGQKDQTNDTIVKFSGKDISISKAVNIFMNGFAMQAMGLKPLLAFGNLVGSLSNAWMVAAEGMHFSEKHFLKALKNLSSRDKLSGALIKYFEVSAHDLTLEKANNLSASKLTEWFTASNMFILMRKGDNFNDGVILLSMLQNYGISKDGKVVRISKLVEDKRSLYDRASLTENGLVIDGLDKFSSEKQNEIYITFRALVQNRANAIKGSLPAEDRNLAGINIMSRMLFMFRNWIPGLASTRFKNFTYNRETGDIDAGRFRVMYGDIISEGFLPTVKEFSKLLLEVGNYGIFYKKDINQKAVDKYYKVYLQQHELSDKKDSSNYLSKEDFIEMRTAKIRGMAKELQIYMSLILLVMATRAMIPDDKDDPTRKIAIMLYRATNRTFLEVGFFINPTNTTGVLTNAIPQMTLLNNLKNLIKNTVQETGYIVTGKQRPKTDKRPPLFYTTKLIPGVGGIVDFLDSFETFNPNSDRNR